MTKNKTKIEEDIEQLEDETTTASDLIKAIAVLQNPKHLESNTILDNYQVNALTMMNWAGQVYDIEFFKHYVAKFPKYRISGDDGRGRKEIIQIAEAIRREKLEQQDKILEILGRR